MAIIALVYIVKQEEHPISILLEFVSFVIFYAAIYENFATLVGWYGYGRSIAMVGNVPVTVPIVEYLVVYATLRLARAGGVPMRVVITGGLGNIGAVLSNRVASRHEVVIFDRETKRTRKSARRFGRRSGRVVFGDIRNREQRALALRGSDVVVHMAAILPPASERNPEFCREINVGGTRTLLEVMREAAPEAKIVLVSSVTAEAGVSDASQENRAGVNVYAQTKASAEAFVRDSGIGYTIVRLAAVMPTGMSYDPAMLRTMYDIPVEAKCEIIVDLDVAAAIDTCIDLLAVNGTVTGKTYVLAGGRTNGCQMTGGEPSARLFGEIGVPTPDAALFNPDAAGFYLRWYDTEEPQRDLQYQNHTFADYRAFLRRRYRALRPILALAAPILSRWLASLSPFRANS